MADSADVTGHPGIFERAWTNRVIRNRVLSFATATDLTTICRVNRDHFHNVVPLLWRSRLIKRAVQELMSCVVDPARYLTYARAVREISVQELPAAGIAPLLLSLPGLQTIVVRNLCAELELVGSVDGNTRGIRFTQASCFPGDVAPLLRKVNAARSAVPLDWPLDIVIDYAIAWEVEHLDVLDNFSLKHPVHINRVDVVLDIAKSCERTSAIHINDAKTILQALPGLQWTACCIYQPLEKGAICIVMQMVMQNVVLLQRFECIYLFWDLTGANTTDDLLAIPLPPWRDQPLSTPTFARSPHAPRKGDRVIRITMTIAYQPSEETPTMRRGRIFSDTLWLEQLAKLCLLLGGPLAKYQFICDSICDDDGQATAEELAEHDELSDMLQDIYRAMLKRTIATMVHGYREARNPGWKRISGLTGQDEA